MYIIRDTLITESDPFLCPQHAQMAESKLVTLVCPFDIWLAQGFYVEFFTAAQRLALRYCRFFSLDRYFVLLDCIKCLSIHY